MIFAGVNLRQLLPERALPECQFLVVQIGWRVEDDLQPTAVVRHDGHGVTTKIIEGDRERQRRTKFPFAYDPDTGSLRQADRA